MTRQDAPAPLRRRGPRPLLLHLTLAALRSNISVAASLTSNPASPPWKQGVPFEAAGRAAGAALAGALAAALRADLGADPASEAPPAAVLAETLRQDAALIAGIAAYRRHPYARDLPDPPTIWSEGASRLLDYAAPGARRDPRPVVLFVPSLVNRAYVLDLAAGNSFLRFLAGLGMRPLLLDWGWPESTERGFTLTDYIAGRLERALEAVAATTGPVVLAGYCMGGLLALAAALRRPGQVRALALLATPWDFHATDAAAAAALAGLAPLFEPALALHGTLPIDALQWLFALRDPFGVGGKYRAFARLDPAGARARRFVALEDWLNDGVPLAAPVARECLSGWYGANTPASGTWRVAGLAVDPGALTVPCLIAAPARDRIVPPESALALARALPHATVLSPGAGHIGMVAGAGAETALWSPFAGWVGSLPAPARRSTLAPKRRRTP